MTRNVTIVGANGRIGTELALCLRDVPGVEVTGICRNRSGSAFLRLSGVRCIHGDVSDPESAGSLLRNADVVVQLAYRAPRSRAGYDENRAVARNVVTEAPEGAQIMAASTIMVRAPDVPLRIPDAYGVEKLLLEWSMRRLAARRGRRLTIVRLGHALGCLQPQSLRVVAALCDGIRDLPDQGRRGSNTVFVASIADAAVRASQNALPDGTFDLVTFPQWTWADVFQFYARALGLPFSPASRRVERPAVLDVARARLRGGLAVVPNTLAERMYGWHLRRAAIRGSAGPSTAGGDGLAAASWRGLEIHPIPGLVSATEALRRYPAAEESWTTKDVPTPWLASEWPKSNRM